MTLSPTEFLALDTNEYIFALRRDTEHPACERLLFDHIGQLSIYLPLQIWRELDANFSLLELSLLQSLLGGARHLERDFNLPPEELIADWQRRGAKKGDAVIVAHLETAQIRTLISGNRHFLAELPDLPFQVLTAAEFLRSLT